jgi:hypothetical protein
MCRGPLPFETVVVSLLCASIKCNAVPFETACVWDPWGSGDNRRRFLVPWQTNATPHFAYCLLNLPPLSITSSVSLCFRYRVGGASPPRPPPVADPRDRIFQPGVCRIPGGPATVVTVFGSMADERYAALRMFFVELTALVDHLFCVSLRFRYRPSRWASPHVCPGSRTRGIKLPTKRCEVQEPPLALSAYANTTIRLERSSRLLKKLDC